MTESSMPEKTEKKPAFRLTVSQKLTAGFCGCASFFVGIQLIIDLWGRFRDLTSLLTLVVVGTGLSAFFYLWSLFHLNEAKTSLDAYLGLMEAQAEDGTKAATLARFLSLGSWVGILALVLFNTLLA